MANSQSDFETTVEQDRWFVVGHVINKMLQAGSLVIPPVAAGVLFYRKRFSFPRLAQITAKGTYFYGAPLGFALGYGRLWNEPDYAIQDRAFRLRHSASQVHTDKFATAGAFAGAAALAVGVPTAGPLLLRVVAGSAFGQGIGILSHLAIVEKEEGPNKMVEEVKSSFPVKEVEKVVEKSKSSN